MNIREKQIMLLALRAGELMLKNGAETARVEDTATRICHAFGIKEAEVFAMPTGIFITVNSPEDHAQVQTYVKRIKSSRIDLERISKINAFSRTLTKQPVSVEDAMQTLSHLSEDIQFAFVFRLLGAAMIASFFTVMFGGGLSDFFCSLIVGTLTYVFHSLLAKLQLNWFIEDFLACAVATTLTLTLTAIGIGRDIDPIIIGSIMIFLPGVAITNAVRDFLAGDTMAGLSRAAEAMLTAVSIAMGVILVFQLYSVSGGVL